MRVLLISPAYFDPGQAAARARGHLAAIRGGNMYFHPFEPPLGLAGLHAWLRKKGHVCRVADAPGEQLDGHGQKKLIRDFSPDLTGVTAMTPTIRMALDAAALSKEVFPKTPVILGGVHPTMSPETVLAHPQVDYVLRGEAEHSLADFLDAGLENPGIVPGLCFKNPDKGLVIQDKAPLIRDISALPLPDYTSFPAKRYIEYTKQLRGIRGISMMITRGCPYSCAFCAVKETLGTRWRARNPEKAAKEMMDLCQELALEGVWFKDSIFNLLPDWTETFAKALIQRENPFSFQINTRVDLVRKEEIQLLKKAGLTQVDLGLESGSSRSLKTLKKKITTDQIRKTVRLLKDLGIRVSGFFMIGIPGETREDIQKTRNLIRELSLDSLSVSIFTPLPGSDLYNSLLARGKITREALNFEHRHFTEARESFCEAPIEELKKFLDSINLEFDEHPFRMRNYDAATCFPRHRAKVRR